MQTKYIALKVEGIEHWLWFDKKYVQEENGEITAKNGWGKGGAFTNLSCKVRYVTGRIESESLQYTN